MRDLTVSKVLFAGLGLSLVASGCSDFLGAGSDKELLEVTLNFDQLVVDRDCDEDLESDIVTIEDPGEFSWLIGYSVDPTDKGESDETWVAQTEYFGEPHQEQYVLARDATHPIQETVSFKVADGDLYRIHFNAIEWDDQTPDLRLHGRLGVVSSFTAGQFDSGNEREFVMLAGFVHTWGQCRLRLEGTRFERRVD